MTEKIGGVLSACLFWLFWLWMTLLMLLQHKYGAIFFLAFVTWPFSLIADSASYSLIEHTGMSVDLALPITFGLIFIFGTLEFFLLGYGAVALIKSIVLPFRRRVKHDR